MLPSLPTWFLYCKEKPSPLCRVYHWVQKRVWHPQEEVWTTRTYCLQPHPRLVEYWSASSDQNFITMGTGGYPPVPYLQPWGTRNHGWSVRVILTPLILSHPLQNSVLNGPELGRDTKVIYHFWDLQKLFGGLQDGHGVWTLCQSGYCCGVVHHHWGLSVLQTCPPQPNGVGIWLDYLFWTGKLD